MSGKSNAIRNQNFMSTLIILQLHESRYNNHPRHSPNLPSNLSSRETLKFAQRNVDSAKGKKLRQHGGVTFSWRFDSHAEQV